MFAEFTGTTLHRHVTSCTCLTAAGLVAAGFCFFSAAAHADTVTVSYAVKPISGSQYQYTYTLSETLSAADNLAIYFPLASASSLTDLGTGSTDFSTFVLQPDASLPADGEFDIVAQTSSPDLSSAFTVGFQDTGSDLPTAQSFTLYDADFNVLQTGSTQPTSVSPSPVPEPASLALLTTGGLALFATRRRARTT